MEEEESKTLPQKRGRNKTAGARSSNKDMGKRYKLIFWPEMSIEKPPKKAAKVGPRVVDSSAVKPTRALSAYIFYSLERTAQLKTLGKTQAEAMKIAGADW
jgi:hypothetical protein